MQWIGLALLALVLGFVHQWISPKIAAALPANATNTRVTQAFFTGAIILIAVFASAFTLRLFGVRTMGGKA